MFSNEASGYGMAGMDVGPWFSGMGFHGGLSLLFLALIVIALVLLISDRQRDDEAGSGRRM